jgi:hypothetical protein
MINSTYYFTVRTIAATTKAHPTVDDRNFEFRFYAYHDPELTVSVSETQVVFYCLLPGNVLG